MLEEVYGDYMHCFASKWNDPIRGGLTQVRSAVARAFRNISVFYKFFLT